MNFTRRITFTDSTAIDAAEYDPKNKVMRIHFLSTDSVWELENVWPADFAALCCAYSPGEVYNERFRNRFDARRIDPTPEKVVLKTKEAHG